MAATLTFTDETANGTKLRSFTLESLSEEMSAREIIRARIYQEVQDYNLNQPEYFHRAGRAHRCRTHRQWPQDQGTPQGRLGKTISAGLTPLSSRNGFFMLVDDRQAENLDQRFVVKVDTEVTFVKLVPLVGG